MNVGREWGFWTAADFARLHICTVFKHSSPLLCYTTYFSDLLAVSLHVHVST